MKNPSNSGEHSVRKSYLSLVFLLKSRIDMQRFVILLLVALLGLPFLLMREGWIVSDSFFYLGSAVRLAKGLRWLTTPGDMLSHMAQHGPVFPSMLAVALKVGGSSINSALFISKSFAFLSLILLYLIGARLYSRKTGLVGTALAATSVYLIDFPTHLLLDHVHACMTLLSLYFVLVARQEKSIGFSCFAGLALGIGFLVKATTMLWAPLPLLMFLTSVRWRQIPNSLLHLVGYYSCLGFTLGSWWLYWYLGSGTVFLASLGGGHSYTLIIRLASISIIAACILGMGYFVSQRSERISAIAQSFWQGMAQYRAFLTALLGWMLWLASSAIFAVLMSRISMWLRSPSEVPDRLVAFVDWWDRIVVRTQPLLAYLPLVLILLIVLVVIKRNEYDHMLLLAFLMYMPLALTAGVPRSYSQPVRYSMTIFWLAYLAMGRVIAFVLDTGVHFVHSRGHLGKPLLKTVANSLIAILCVFSVWNGWNIVQTHDPMATWYHSDVWNNPAVIATSQWMSKNIPKGSTIVSSFFYAPAWYFYLQGDYHILWWFDNARNAELRDMWPMTPNVYLGEEDERLRFTLKKPPDGMPNIVRSDPLHVRFWLTQDFEQYSFGNTSLPIDLYTLLDQGKLVDFLLNRSADYLVFTVGPHPFQFHTFPEFFRDHPAFHQVFSSEWDAGGKDVYTIYLFQVDREGLSYADYPVTIETQTLLNLFEFAKALDPGKGEYELLQALGGGLIRLAPQTSQDYALYLYNRIANIYASNGDYELAALQLRVALAESPNRASEILATAQTLFPPPFNGVGVLVLMGDIDRVSGRVSQARDAYLQALEMPNARNESRAFAHQGLGEIAASEGEYRQAIEEFRQALQLSIVDAAAVRSKMFTALGSLYQADGEIERAIEAYYQALDVGGNSRQWKQALLASDEICFLDFVKRVERASIITSDIGQVRPAVFMINNQPRPVLFSHPSARVSYSVQLPADAALRFAPMLAPEVWHAGMGDGVQFEIYLSDISQTRYRLYSEYIDPKNNPIDREWTEQEIDVSCWSGQTVTLTFRTGPGPNVDDRYDWAGWGEPCLVQPVAYDFLDHLSEAKLVSFELGQTRVETQTINYDTRSVLFQHPTSCVVYSLTLPHQSTLYFGIGMDPAVWSPDRGDGVEYRILVRSDGGAEHLVFSRYIDPKNNLDDRRWFDEWVDLSSFGGQPVDVIFEALPGPAGDANYDWGGWSTPVLVDETLPGENGAGIAGAPGNTP